MWCSMSMFFLSHKSQLHPNARARLKAKLSLLPNTLFNPFASFRDAILHDHHVPNTVSVNGTSSFGACDFAVRDEDINSRASV
jgi:hypothetical protein